LQAEECDCWEECRHEEEEARHGKEGTRSRRNTGTRTKNKGGEIRDKVRNKKINKMEERR
jgi:hypothetical protein